MSANLEAKKALVEEIKDKLSRAKTVVFVDYRGITVDQDTKLRSQFRKAGAEYKVYKNRLMARALDELGYKDVEKYLEGTSAVAFGYEDEIAPAKLLKDAVSDNCAMSVKFGIYNNQIVDENEIKKLASIPSRQTLLGQLVGLLSSPMRSLAIAVKAIADKQ